MPRTLVLLLAAASIGFGGLLCFSSACSTSADASDGGAGADGAVAVIDVCDAFTGVGTACPLESPVRCFPACEASGCFCRGSDAGAVWMCQTDLSCVPDCGPLDDGCAASMADYDF